MHPDDSVDRGGEDRTKKRRIARGPAPRPAGAMSPEDLLQWRAGRGPVTDAEALLMLHDKELRAANNAKRTVSLPSELPRYDDASTQVVLRVTDLGLLQAQARAYVEGTNLSAVVDTYLLEYGRGIPEDPDEVERRQMDLYRLLGIAPTDDLTEAERIIADNARLRRVVAELKARLRELEPKPRGAGTAD